MWVGQTSRSARVLQDPLFGERTPVAAQTPASPSVGKSGDTVPKSARATNLPALAGNRSFAVVHHFDRIDAGVVDDWHKRQHDFALGVGSDSTEGFFYGALRSAGGTEYIEIAQQRDSVAVNIENAASNSPGAGLCRAEPRLRKS